jgi:hypothetical protein
MCVKCSKMHLAIVLAPMPAVHKSSAFHGLGSRLSQISCREIELTGDIGNTHCRFIGVEKIRCPFSQAPVKADGRRRLPSLCSLTRSFWMTYLFVPTRVKEDWIVDAAFGSFIR